MEFEDFWNPPQPPDENGDNNGIDDLTPSDLPPSGTGGTGWYKKSSIAETTQNQGGQGGTGVQGIGLDLEKNTNFVLEELPAEKIVTDALTGVSRGGQSECRVDSCISPQDELDYTTYPNLTCDTVEANRNQANEIKQKLLTAHTKEELTAIKREFSSRFKWVWRNLMSQRRTLKEIAAVQQLDIFASQTASAEISESAAQRELSLEQLSEVLEVVDSPEDFATAIAGHAVNVVQDCIFMSSTPPRRRLLESWLESLQSGE
jgi:hypothetical protein